MTTSTYQFHPNSGDHRLLRPVTCIDCKKPLNDLATYAMSRCRPGFFYFCEECGTKRKVELEERNNLMAEQARAITLHKRLVVYLRVCGNLGILQLATAAFGPDDHGVARMRGNLIANGTLPPDVDVLLMPHDRLPRDETDR